MADDGMEALDALPKGTQAGRLLQIADEAEYWHTPQGGAYATLKVRDHWESYAINDAPYRDWLVHSYYRAHGHGPNSNSLRNVLTLLTARATQAGSQYPAHMRIAEHDGDIYIDTGNPDWQVIHVTPGRWAVEPSSPVRFTRAHGMLPMATPVRNGNIADLYSMVNVREEDLPLLTGWLLGALYPRGPYPILLLQGPPGSAKSTLARLLKDLVDPNDLALRAAPREMRDLQIAALHSRCVALDNLPHVPQELSDTLCRLSTGDATSARLLYSNWGETAIKVQCPIIVTGIGSVASQADLLDRSIVLGLHIIPGDRRVPESQYWQAWRTRRASVLGALLDATAHGLRERNTTHLAHLPRMADFAHWVAACEGALWPRGRFLEAYDQNRSDAHEIALEADPVGNALVRMMETSERWSGTISELLTSLEWAAGEKAREQRNWPTTPSVLSRRLSRIEGVLAESGIIVDAYRAGHDRARTITITRRADGEDGISTSETLKFGDADGADGADGIFTAESHDTEGAEGADGADGVFTVNARGADGEDGISSVDTRGADGADGIFAAENNADMRTARTTADGNVSQCRPQEEPCGERVSQVADGEDGISSPFNAYAREKEKKDIKEMPSAPSALPATPVVARAEARTASKNNAVRSRPRRPQSPAGVDALYALVGQTVYTAQGPATLVQVFGDRVAVLYPMTAKVTYLRPEEVALDPILL